MLISESPVALNFNALLLINGLQECKKCVTSSHDWSLISYDPFLFLQHYTYIHCPHKIWRIVWGEEWKSIVWGEEWKRGTCRLNPLFYTTSCTHSIRYGTRASTGLSDWLTANMHVSQHGNTWCQIYQSICSKTNGHVGIAYNTS